MINPMRYQNPTSEIQNPEKPMKQIPQNYHYMP